MTVDSITSCLKGNIFNKDLWTTRTMDAFDEILSK